MTTKTSKLKMTQKEIESYTRDFLKRAYNMELGIPVKINGRLSSTLGRFRHRGSSPISIEISKNYLIHGSLDHIKSTLRHEAIHYALCAQGRAFDDGDEDFESELVKHESHSTGTVHVKIKQLRVTYECGCGNEWVYRRSLPRNNVYECGSCEGILIETNREHVFE